MPSTVAVVVAALTPQKVRARLTALVESIQDDWAERNELTEIDRLLHLLEEQVELTADRDAQRAGRQERWAASEENIRRDAEDRRRSFLQRGGHIRVDKPGKVVDEDEVAVEPAIDPLETGDSTSDVVIIGNTDGGTEELPPPAPLPVTGHPDKPGKKKSPRK